MSSARNAPPAEGLTSDGLAEGRGGGLLQVPHRQREGPLGLPVAMRERRGDLHHVAAGQLDLAAEAADERHHHLRIQPGWLGRAGGAGRRGVGAVDVVREVDARDAGLAEAAQC